MELPALLSFCACSYSLHRQGCSHIENGVCALLETRCSAGGIDVVFRSLLKQGKLGLRAELDLLALYPDSVLTLE